MTPDARLAASQYARCKLLLGVDVHYWRHAYAASGPEWLERSVERTICLPANVIAAPVTLRSCKGS